MGWLPIGKVAQSKINISKSELIGLLPLFERLFSVTDAGVIWYYIGLKYIFYSWINGQQYANPIKTEH